MGASAGRVWLRSKLLKSDVVGIQMLSLSDTVQRIHA